MKAIVNFIVSAVMVVGNAVAQDKDAGFFAELATAASGFNGSRRIDMFVAA